MKHASNSALASLAPLIMQLRALPGFAEKTPGIFYRKGTAFLHFHEDPAGLFADVKIAGAWERFAINDGAEIAGLLQRVKAVISR